MKLLYVLLMSAAIDPRLSTARKVFVVPVDELGDDKGVASCMAERLNPLTPLELVTSQAEADVVLRVSAHIPGATNTSIFGTPPTAKLAVTAPDGSVLWQHGVKYSEALLQQHSGATLANVGKSAECGLADALIDSLRNAMRKARDKR